MKEMRHIGTIILAVSLLTGCRGSTSDQDFADNVRLHLAASDRYDQSKTVFRIEFSTVGKTIWPGGNSQLVLFVDGEETDSPSQWSRHVITSHILADAPRSAFWWMTLSELTNWIGSGEHELQMQFRKTKSNILNITVSTEGRVICNPELKRPTWEKVR